jgi:AAA15 family ATPase/GTPase
MLVAFTVGNFRSFKEPVMLSMLPIRRLEGDERLNGSHLIKTGNSEHPSLLKTAAIYGANASGKSNLLMGLAKMCEFVLDNLKELRRGRKPVNDPFAFSKDSVKSPTLYEVQFLIGDHLYRYGFEIGKHIIEEEWLYCDEAELFYRSGMKIVVRTAFEEGMGKETQTREDALFLSVCGSYNGAISKEIISLFQKVRVSGLSRNLFSLSPDYLARYLRDDKISEKLLGLIRLADPGISHFRQKTEKITSKELNLFAGGYLDVEKERISFEAVYGSDLNNTLRMEDLSAGTIKMIHTAGDVLRAINNDRIVVIDEIDIQLHPLLIEMILKSFHSQPTSKAQLIFTTHNTYPLRTRLLRRDQFWFVNKMPDFSSYLINFAEFKIHPDTPSYDEDYMNGRFGGIPTLEIPEIFGKYEYFEEEDE